MLCTSQAVEANKTSWLRKFSGQSFNLIPWGLVLLQDQDVRDCSEFKVEMEFPVRRMSRMQDGHSAICMLVFSMVGLRFDCKCHIRFGKRSSPSDEPLSQLAQKAARHDCAYRVSKHLILLSSTVSRTLPVGSDVTPTEPDDHSYVYDEES